MRGGEGKDCSATAFLFFLFFIPILLVLVCESQFNISACKQVSEDTVAVVSAPHVC